MLWTPAQSGLVVPIGSGQVVPYLRRTRGAAAGFSPSDIVGLHIWLHPTSGFYDATSGGNLVTTNNSPIARWADASGGGRHFTKATSNQPLLATSFLNGYDAVNFDGWPSSKWLIGPTLSLTAGTGFLVVKADANDSGNGLWHFGDLTANVHYTYSDGNLYESFGTNARKNTGNPTPNVSAWHVYEVVAATNDWRVYFDGTLHYSTASNTVYFPSAGQLPNLGGSIDPGNFSLAGYIAEFILYDSALGTTDRQSVEAYLAGKYGL